MKPEGVGAVGEQAVAAPTRTALTPLLRFILIKAAKDFSADDVPNVAASVTFYALLAIFPALSALMSLYGLFGDPTEPQKAIADLHGLLPEGAVQVIGDDLQRLALLPPGPLGLAFALSVLVSLYSATAGMKALITGLAIAYEDKQRRSFIGMTLVSAAFTVVLVAATVAGVGLGVVAPVVFTEPLLRWPVLMICVLATFYSLYRFGPQWGGRRHHTMPGGLTAAVAWMAMSAAFSWYAANFGNFNRTFGSLGAVAGFMTWIWLSVMVVLFGAELNAAVDAAIPRK